MQVKITNTNYGYLGEGKINFSATVEIQDDVGTVLHANGVGVRENVESTGWKKRALTNLIKQAQEIYDQYKVILGALVAEFPAAKTPADVMTQLAAQIEAEVK